MNTPTKTDVAAHYRAMAEQARQDKLAQDTLAALDRMTPQARADSLRRALLDIAGMDVL
jgi:hypothetical protein